MPKKQYRGDQIEGFFRVVEELIKVMFEYR